MTANPPPEILDRLPPQDLDAERSVLSACLIDPRVIAEISRALDPSDFYAEGHQAIYRNLIALDEGGGKVDVLLLADRMKTSGELEEIGGEAYIAEVATAAPYAVHVKRYAGIVKRKAAARAIIRAGIDLLRGGYDDGRPADELLANADATISSVDAATHGESLTSAGNACIEALRRVEEINSRGDVAGMLTGLPPLDEMLGGFFPGELIVVGARPGVGKTSLACQIAYHFATHDRGVYFATLEMGAAELIMRVLCGQSGVNSQAVRIGKLDPGQYGELTTASGPLIDAPWWFDDRPRMTTADIRRACYRCQRRGLSFVVVDYLQRVAPSNRARERREQVAEQARDFKELARELNVPILLLAQLNRSSERENRRPKLSDLKEAGEIEQEADVVMFPWQEPAEDDAEKEARADPRNPVPVKLLVAKNRNGPTPSIEMQWRPASTRFEERGAVDWAGSNTGAHDDFAQFR